jgi:two-component system chemotaxis response regulator CheY
VPRDVVIVDDHSGFRVQARKLLERMGYRVVGEAATGSEALGEVRRLKPDVVLLDIQLPDIDGITVAASLTSAPPAPAVVLVSARDPVDYGSRLDSCGALGFIAKPDLSADSLMALLEP